MGNSFTNMIDTMEAAGVAAFAAAASIAGQPPEKQEAEPAATTRIFKSKVDADSIPTVAKNYSMAAGARMYGHSKATLLPNFGGPHLSQG